MIELNGRMLYVNNFLSMPMNYIYFRVAILVVSE